MIGFPKNIDANWLGLKRYEEFLRTMKSQYSMFELSLNADFDFLCSAFKCCNDNCVTIRNGRNLNFWMSRAREFPHAIVVFVFRSFFEEGNGNDFYQSAADKCGAKRGDVTQALRSVWLNVFPSDADASQWSAQRNGIPRYIFCSRCWLIKNFQQRMGNSELCNSVRYFKNFGDKTLRLHSENFPSDIVTRFGGNFKRLLESPVCRLEREYLIDFADTGAVDNERFAWFEQLDVKSKAALGELLLITIDRNGVPCFSVGQDYDFDVDDSVDRIDVTVSLRRAKPCACHFVKRRGRWCYHGDERCLVQPIWKVTGIIQREYSNNDIVKTEDILWKKLSECCCDRYGAFLVNAGNPRAGIYAPFARRRIPVGRYFAYVFEYLNDNHFKVLCHIKNSADALFVRANGNPVGNDRSFIVNTEDESISLSFNDNNGNQHVFDFGVNRRSPIRGDGGHEKFISRHEPDHLFINYRKWPSYSIDPGWRYEVNGVSAQAIDKSNLYKTGRLVFSCCGHQYEERCVTFVDFSSEEVCARFPVLGVGEPATITLSDCGSLDGSYTVAQDCTTFGISLPGGDWQLNVPIRRDGVVFRTEEGDEALSLPFKEGDAIVAKDIAIEDLQKLRCMVYCADAAEYAVVTSMICSDETTCQCHIPLIKDRDGFVFSDKRRYLASRAGRSGDKMLADLLSNQLRIKSFVIEKRVGNNEERAAKYCQINLYDPKMEPPVERPSIVNGSITIKLYVPYSTRNCVQKVMKWLPSTSLDSDTGVREFEFPEEGEAYKQLEGNGRWCINLRKTTMHQDVDGVLRSGASLLAFMVDRVKGGSDRLISGGFCLLGNEHNLQVVRENWAPASAFHASMHERYGTNAARLADMFGMLTLLQWDDWVSIDNGRRELKRRISQLMANINSIGRRADMYMNSLYNARPDQWSGYIYFAGWYFVEKVYEEMSSRRDEEEGGLPIEDCRCLSSSTGKRIWSPLLFSRRAYIMTTNGGAQKWWREYYEELSQHEVTIDGFCPDEYQASIAPVLKRVGIGVENGLDDAVNKLYQQILDWRKDVDTRDIVCDDNEAATLFCNTQALRNVLLELSEIDKWFKEEDTSGSVCSLFCDLLKGVDARHWYNNRLF